MQQSGRKSEHYHYLPKVEKLLGNCDVFMIDLVLLAIRRQNMQSTKYGYEHSSSFPKETVNLLTVTNPVYKKQSTLTVGRLVYKDDQI